MSGRYPPMFVMCHALGGLHSIIVCFIAVGRGLIGAFVLMLLLLLWKSKRALVKTSSGKSCIIILAHP